MEQRQESAQDLRPKKAEKSNPMHKLPAEKRVFNEEERAQQQSTFSDREALFRFRLAPSGRPSGPCLQLEVFHFTEKRDRRASAGPTKSEWDGHPLSLLKREELTEIRRM